jgi:hypothetical protein
LIGPAAVGIRLPGRPARLCMQVAYNRTTAQFFISATTVMTAGKPCI